MDKLIEKKFKIERGYVNAVLPTTEEEKKIYDRTWEIRDSRTVRIVNGKTKEEKFVKIPVRDNDEFRFIMNEVVPKVFGIKKHQLNGGCTPPYDWGSGYEFSVK
jgi:hypothetical protein